MNRARIQFWSLLLAGMAGALISIGINDSIAQSDGHLDFNYDSSYASRPFTSAESTTVERAIDSIATPPPSSIRFRTAGGSTTSVACTTFARILRNQLRRGDMEAETTNTRINGATLGDGQTTTAGDKMNVAPGLISRSATSDSARRILEAVLVHEAVHKTQASTMSKPAKETEGYGAETAYLDCVRLGNTPRERFTRAVRDSMRRLLDDATAPHRVAESVFMNGYDCFVEQGSGSAPDILKSYHLWDTNFYEYDLPMRVTDIMGFPNYYGPGMDMLLCCGMTYDGIGALMKVMLLDGYVEGIGVMQEFAHPFYSMNWRRGTNEWYIVSLDFTGERILAAFDTNGDLMPDTLTGVFAEAPAFPQLGGMLSVEATLIPALGRGLVINHADEHFGDVKESCDDRWFLMDTDNNGVADMITPIQTAQIISFVPCIQEPLPRHGDQAVYVWATVGHTITIWTCDATGTVWMEFLGSVLSTTCDGNVCELFRPLMNGEYIIPYDLFDARSPTLPTQVGGVRQPQALTICYDPEMLSLILRWEPVAGAHGYHVFVSDDPSVFPNLPAYTTGMPELIIPLSEGERMFFRVTAFTIDPER
ncbi:MAG: hypothetical protein ACOZB3_01580 [Calditrichota bacterium]